ncbi:c-type cytochrome [Tranquillimonas alkanivorans]|uniref:Cytochrome c556 n=1 Tax=Tranquillimonas alkanivorans TaxID=441119 RepID=A0A1I5RND5_9RHOB|nr:cytochrome c [Tranquillimonas alkanivorans]SFP59900.1 Cytochrome c556 [Tranquillimonas alkanivorans]
MLNTRLLAAAGGLAAAIAANASLAESHIDPAIEAAVKARQAHMTLYSFNLGLLGGMAKGEIEYDADTASSAASNLARLAGMNQGRYWPEGSSIDDIENTRALTAIWTEGSEVMTHVDTLVKAAATLEGAAGEGLDPLRGALAEVGRACGGCHEDYRQSDD